MFKTIYKQIRLSKGRQVLKRTYSMISSTESSRADKTKPTAPEDKMVVYRGVVISRTYGGLPEMFYFLTAELVTQVS